MVIHVTGNCDIPVTDWHGWEVDIFREVFGVHHRVRMNGDNKVLFRLKHKIHIPVKQDRMSNGVVV